MPDEGRPIPPVPQPAAWTPATIAQFWDYWAGRPDRLDKYFSHQVGRGVINFARFAGLFRGNVLDYGCGPGFLLAHLLERDVQVYAADYSRESVTRANQRHAGAARWHGAVVAEALPTALPEGFFDLTLCLETFEHLTDEVAAQVAGELHRVTRPGGAVLITTPCAEMLHANEIFCPFCRTAFHEYQHLRSITPAGMTEFLTAQGFDVRFCRGLRFDHFQEHFSLPRPADWSVNTLGPWTLRHALGLFDTLWPRPRLEGWRLRALARHAGPHLCTVAVRR